MRRTAPYPHGVSRWRGWSRIGQGIAARKGGEPIHQGWDPYPFILLNLALSFQSASAAPVIIMSQNRQQDIDRRAAENDYRINVKAKLEIELLHEKIDQLREREVLKLTEAVRMLTELLEQSASGARESDSEGGRP